jgi:hypothetical protein
MFFVTSTCKLCLSKYYCNLRWGETIENETIENESNIKICENDIGMKTANELQYSLNNDDKKSSIFKNNNDDTV